MIAAIYARKSTELCTILVASLVLFVTLILPLPVRAQATGDVPYEHYVQGTSRIGEYFVALYEEFGSHVRHAQILKKCGYKKEAEEIEAHTQALVKKKLDGLIESDAKSKKLPSVGAIVVAAEGAKRMWIGYALGFRESFGITSDLLLARDYEAVCKNSLLKASELSGEAAK